MAKKKRSKKQAHSRSGSKRQYEKDSSAPQKRQMSASPLGTQSPQGALPGNEERPTQNQLTFGRLGFLLIAVQLPIFAFALLNLVDWKFGYEWRPWVTWSPIYLGIIVLLVVISALKLDTPFIAHITWNFVLAVLEIYFLLLVVRKENPHMSFWRYFPLYIPHWIISVVVILIGLGLLLKNVVHKRNGTSSGGDNDGTPNNSDVEERSMLLREEEHDARSVYYLVSVGYIIIGLGWGIITLLVCLRETRVVPSYSLSWGVIFIPWYALDLFFFVCLIVMLVFSFGASQSAVFTINQQLIMLTITALSTLVKALLNMEFEGTSPVPPGAVMGSLLALCIAVLLLGVCFTISRNSNNVISGKQTFYSVDYNMAQFTL